MAATTDFTINCEFTSPPETVFEFLTDQDKWDAYTGYPGGKGLSAEVGSTSTLTGITATVAEAVPGQKLVWKDWNIAGVFPEDVKSTVTWELSPSATGGTSVTLTHSGCAVVEGQDFVAGWHTHWIDPIAKFEELPVAKRQKLEKKQVTPAVCHAEIMVSDFDRATKFYSTVFDWKITDWDDKFKFFSKTGEGAIGGGFALQPAEEFPPPGTACGTTPVITVSNVEEALAAVIAAGGTEVKGISDVPDGSRYIVFADTEGNVLSAFEESQKAKDAAAAAGNEEKFGIRWFELNCVNTDELTAFYGKVFGWSFTTFTPTYTCIDASIKDDDHINGGIVTTETNVAAAADGKIGVLVYIDVDDVAAYLTKVTDAGGAVHTPLTEIAGTGGCYAAFNDPAGNRVGLYNGGDGGESGESAEGAESTDTPAAAAAAE